MNTGTHHRRAAAFAAIALALALPLAGCQTVSDTVDAPSAPAQLKFRPTADQLERDAGASVPTPAPTPTPSPGPESRPWEDATKPVSPCVSWLMQHDTSEAAARSICSQKSQRYPH